MVRGKSRKSPFPSCSRLRHGYGGKIAMLRGMSRDETVVQSKLQRARRVPDTTGPAGWLGTVGLVGETCRARVLGQETKHNKKVTEHNTSGSTTLAEEQHWRKSNAGGSTTLPEAQHWQERNAGRSAALAEARH